MVILRRPSFALSHHFSRAALTLLAAVFALPLAPPASAQIVHLAFGDSITQGFGDDGLDEDEKGGYPPRLEAALDDAVVRNHGVGGEATPEGLTRLDAVLAEGGDILLLMEGTNDISRTGSRAISLETTLFNLGEMARKAEDAGLEAVHATVIPRDPVAKIDRDNVENQELNQRIRDLAGRQGRRLADNFEMFSVQDSLFVRFYMESPPGGVGHPNAAGYDLMTGVFADVLEGVDSVPPVPGLLAPGHGELEVAADVSIDVDVWDFGAGLDSSADSLELLVDGVPVAAEVTVSDSRATLSHAPPAPLSGLVTIALRARDLASPANLFDREVARFFVAGTRPIEGDVDRDGRVDGSDLIRLALVFGLSRSARAFDPRADLDGNGTIDGIDLSILASNFGRSL